MSRQMTLGMGSKKYILGDPSLVPRVSYASWRESLLLSVRPERFLKDAEQVERLTLPVG